jgi:hypothetical protein
VKVRDSEGSTSYSKIIRGRGENPDVLLTSGKNAKIALELALKDAVYQLVNDPEFIQSLLGKEFII